MSRTQVLAVPSWGFTSQSKPFHPRYSVIEVPHRSSCFSHRSVGTAIVCERAHTPSRSDRKGSLSGAGARSSAGPTSRSRRLRCALRRCCCLICFCFRNQCRPVHRALLWARLVLLIAELPPNLARSCEARRFFFSAAASAPEVPNCSRTRSSLLASTADKAPSRL